jgi:ribonuclease HII
VIAKVARDGFMVELAASYPVYGWQSNKGYAAPEHRAALLEVGPCEEHRRSWHLLVSDQPTLFDHDELGSGDDDDPGWADPAGAETGCDGPAAAPRRRRARQLRPAGSPAAAGGLPAVG